MAAVVAAVVKVKVSVDVLAVMALLINSAWKMAEELVEKAQEVMNWSIDAV